MKSELLKIGKVEINTILITAFLSVVVLAGLLWQNVLIVFASMLVVSAIFIWQTPQAGLLAALLTTIIFGEHFSLLPLKIEDAIYKIYLLDFVLIITFLCWLLQEKVKLIKLIKPIKQNKKNLFLLIFLAFIILNLFRSFLTASDLTLAMGTFKNYIYCLVYFLVIFMIHSKEQILKFLKTFLYGGIILLGFVIYGWLNGQGLWSAATPGLHYLSGLQSYYLTFSIIILLVLLLNKAYVFGKIKTFVIFLISTLGLVGGMFRHLWLGLATAFLSIFSLAKFRQKKNFIQLGLIIVCLLILISLIWLWLGGLAGNYNENFLNNNFFTSISSRGQTIFETSSLAESAAGWRLATWSIAFKKFSSNPIIGIGLGQKFYFEYLGWLDLIDIRNIHNDFAALLVQLGLLGFIPFLMFNIYSIKDLLKLFRPKADPPLAEKTKNNSLAQMLSGFYVISIFGIFFGIYLMFNGTSIFYWSVVGLISCLANSE